MTLLMHSVLRMEKKFLANVFPLRIISMISFSYSLMWLYLLGIKNPPMAVSFILPQEVCFSYCLLFTVLCGDLCCEADGQIFVIRRNQGMLLLPGQVHSYRTEKYCDSYLCVFSSDLVEEFYTEVKGCRFINPVIDFRDESLCDILQNKNSDIYLIKSVLYGICSRIYNSSELVKKSHFNDVLANSIADYIQDNYKECVSLKEAAKELGYNYSYLSTFFNNNFSMNFSTYVNGYRVPHAEEYLIKTDKKITEISKLSGFETIRNFNRIFKKETGKTPNEYRREHLKRN